MATAFAAVTHLRIQEIFAVGTEPDDRMPRHIAWQQASHPVPDERSVAAAERALAVASRVGTNDALVLLLSGGASALMAAPLAGLSLEDKQHAIRTMLLAGADIVALNTVRKHLSRVKGGRLAEACRGTTLTLAVSDVIGDDLSVIGSGPGVPDDSTWAQAADAIARLGGPDHRPAVQALVREGRLGALPETPKRGDPSVARASGAVIASRRDAIDAAVAEAQRRGYHAVVIEEPIVGEARVAAREWWSRTEPLRDAGRPVCVLSAGETTVRVTGQGRGGRNQEFVLALVDLLGRERGDLLVASFGTDGIDGPTDAAGALADATTRARAAALGFSPDAFLDDNNSYEFFAMLGDLIHLGPTDTNVGDLQVLLIGGPTSSPSPLQPL
jgi:glycerate 2-kinase